MSRPPKRYRPATRRGRSAPPREIPAAFLDHPPALRREGDAKRILDLIDNLNPGGRKK